MDAEPTAIPVAASEPVRGRVIQATQLLLAKHGLGVSMDQIASAAGVGRRSLFRHFGSRDVLVARALDETVSGVGDRLATRLKEQAPFPAWLLGVVSEEQQSQIDAGRAYWELTASNDDVLGPELIGVNRRRRARRRRWSEEVAQRGWLLAGGEGPPPDAVLDAFALTLSGHATRSLVVELRVAPERAVLSVVSILSAVIQAHQQSDADRR